MNSATSMTRSHFLRLVGLGAVGAFVGRPFAALGAIDYDFHGTPSGLRPYLHGSRPNSMRVSWWTDADAGTTVEFGLSESALNRSASGTVNPMADNYCYHAVQLTGLQPDTYYYYRAKTERITSAIFRFRTPKAIGTATGKFRVLVIGDNQIIDPAQRRYERLVERAKKKIEAMHGVPIEEAVDFVLMPGDQVDVGTLEHYRHLHFGFCGWISPNLPIMTTIGNHETYSDPGLANYKAIFNYDELNCLGVTSPDPKVYYAYQFANIAFVHTSSEHISEAQTGWVRNLVNAAKADPGLDWMISVCHRPYQAEQYIGDISSWFRNTAMPVFAETEKHVLNIGAHHHLYARGQTRQWPVYHIISGGSAWDQYWGQSNESDYDDVQKTIAHWTWQLIEFDLDARTMDVKCFAEANVKFPAATRWSYNSRLIDQFSRKLGRPAPSTPALDVIPATPVTLPLVLRSSAFVSSGAESLNSTWFQVATDMAFTDLKLDRIRDIENFYGDSGSPSFEPVNIHAGVNILEYNLPPNGLPNGTYQARVRHRDTNALWSAWSPVLGFTVEGSLVTGNPAILLAKSVFAPAEDISIVYENGPGLAKDWVGIYKKSDKPGSGTGTVASTSWKYVNDASRANGILNFTTDLPAGEWFAAFFRDDGYTEVAERVAFYVGGRPQLTSNKAAYAGGEPVSLIFSSAPGLPTDWIGIFKEGKVVGIDEADAWNYLNGTRTPTAGGVTAGTLAFAGLPKGYYFADYLVNNGYLAVSERIHFSIGTEIAAISMASPTIVSGHDLVVDFSGGPGTPKDWLGIFKKGEIPGENVLTSYLYVDGKTAGKATFKLPDLAAGEYFLALFTNDSYTEVSNRLSFTVSPKEALNLEKSSFNGTAMLLGWRTENGSVYRIQQSTDPGGRWETVRTITGNGDIVEESVGVDPNTDPKMFFRVVSP